MRFDTNAPLTKQTLGWLIVALGLAAAMAVAGIDLARAGRDVNFGPAQRAAVAGALLLAGFGATLIPLGGDASPVATRTSPIAGGSPASPLPPALLFVTRALFVLALVVFVAYLLIYIHYAVALFRFPFDYDQGEGFELNDSILFARGEWPYRDNQVYPFYASNYPPLFHLMAVPLIWLFGPAYWTGRLLSFLATLVTAAAIGYAVWRETRRSTISLLSGLAYLASNYVYHIGPLFRQHITMVMFETLAIVTLASMDSETDNRIDPDRHKIRLPVARPLTPLIFLLLAGYTKQLAIATVAAALVFLFLRGPKRALTAGLGFAAVAGAIFLAINRATAGQWWVNIILANVNEYKSSQAIELYRQWFSLHFALVALAVCWLAYEIYWSRLSAYSIWFAFAVATAALSGKWGAGESYFTTAVAAACLCSGLAIGTLMDASAKWGPRRAAALAVLIPVIYLAQGARLLHLPTAGLVFGPLARALGLPADSTYYDSQGYTQLGRPPDAADIAAGERILSYVRKSPGPALTEEAAFPIHAGKDVVTNPTQLLNLYKNGLYDPTSLMNMIGNKEFGVVVLRAQFYPPPVLGAIGAAYEPVDDIQMNGFTYRILIPR
ncbi:MAG: hypothetical protein HY260_04825 [Chloroflexi bacterium]|nr:hypothetical protein [Chloroflexota bacterium]